MGMRAWLKIALFGVALVAGVPEAAAQTSPEPSSCAQPNRYPMVVRAVPPETPVHLNHGVEVYVQIKLSDTSAIEDASIYRSSGIPALDQAALSATYKATFQTEIVNCKPQPATYLYIVDFEPDEPDKPRSVPSPSVPAPTMASPAGWESIPNDSRSPESSGFFWWRKNSSSILVSGGPRKGRSLSQIVHDVMHFDLNASPSPRFELVSNGSVRLCHGTQEGWRIETGARGAAPKFIVTFTLSPIAYYLSMYMIPSGEHVDRAASTALDTLCAPA